MVYMEVNNQHESSICFRSVFPIWQRRRHAFRPCAVEDSSSLISKCEMDILRDLYVSMPVGWLAPLGLIMLIHTHSPIALALASATGTGRFRTIEKSVCNVYVHAH